MTLNRDQLQLVDWYNQGYGSVALRHGLSEQLMSEWLRDQGYGSDLAERMLGEFKAEQIGYQINCLDPLSAAVWLLLLTDKDKGQGNTAEQINTVVFDVIYGIKGIKDLADVDGTGLYQLTMTIVDETELDHEQIMDWLDQRLADLSANESKLLLLLSSPQQQQRSYYFGLIDCFRALN